MSSPKKYPNRGIRYDNEEDRRAGLLVAQHRYDMERTGKKWYCECCNKSLSLRNKAAHLKCKKHKLNFERKNECPTCSEYESSNNDDE